MSRKIRVVLLAAACLAMGGALRLTIPATTTTVATNTTSEDGGQDASALLTHSGYMVAVG